MKAIEEWRVRSESRHMGRVRGGKKSLWSNVNQSREANAVSAPHH